MTYTAPIVPALRGKLSSEIIRDQFAQIATEFALFPERLPSSAGFTGGQWNDATLQDPTITLGIIGNNDSPCVVVAGYVAFRESAYSSLGTGNVGFSRGEDGRLKLYDGSTIKWFSDNAHNLVIGDGVTEPATTATGGFIYITTMNGPATGAPTEYDGASPLIYDRAGNRLAVHEIGLNWRYTMPLHTFDGSATAVYDPANLVDGAGVTTTVALVGAALGQFVRVSFSLDLQGVMLFAWVSATDVISVRFQNESGGAIDLGSGTITVHTANG